MRLATLILSVALAVGLVAPAAQARSRPAIDPYEGLATWVDIYDAKPWRNPAGTVKRLRAKGVRTIYLQTSNWQASHGLENWAELGAYVEASHAAGIRVVAWYVPSFKKPSMDLRRSLKAIDFRSPKGQRFDSFAMDIESDLVDDIGKRNARLMWLSEKVRRHVGSDYSLGAIIPDPKTQRYWPRFPYRDVARLYDVFVPMSYFTFRTKGYGKVYKYTRDSLNIIRRETGRDAVPIHIIGGLAGYASRPEVQAFSRAVREHGAVGASLYDLPLMTPGDWDGLKHLDRTRKVKPRKPAPIPELPGRFARPHGSLSAVFL